jgi:hypothetical protein
MGNVDAASGMQVRYEDAVPGVPVWTSDPVWDRPQGFIPHGRAVAAEAGAAS